MASKTNTSKKQSTAKAVKKYSRPKYTGGESFAFLTKAHYTPKGIAKNSKSADRGLIWC